MTSLIATPTDSRGSSVAGASAVVAKMVAWGLRMPSVPPDHTSGTLSGAGCPCSASTSRKARSARMRV